MRSLEKQCGQTKLITSNGYYIHHHNKQKKSAFFLYCVLMCFFRFSQKNIFSFMGPCIVIIFYYINPNKMHMLQSLFYLTTVLHVSGVTITHLQEHKTTVTTASGNRYTVLLSAAIVEELELVSVCCGWRTLWLCVLW
jgi:hypothetical protein